MLNRTDIVRAIAAYLQPFEDVNAVWEGGAAAWKRVDEWSDIDLMVDVNDHKAADIMKVINVFLEVHYGVELKYEIQQPVWPGIVQTFFLLKDSSPFMLIDFAIIKNSSKDKFLEKQIHGVPVIHFDKKGIVQSVPVNEGQLRTNLLNKVPLLKARFEIFQVLVEKELMRGNSIEALNFYMGFTLQPLVEAIRMEYAPYHSNFGSRYIHYDLPKEEAALLQWLYFVANADELKVKWNTAKDKFRTSIKRAEEKLKINAYA